MSTCKTILSGGKRKGEECGRVNCGYHKQPKPVDSCPICLEQIKENNCCTLKCNHNFHFECIMELYRSNNNFSNKCPMCRDEFTERIQQQYIHHHIILPTPTNIPEHLDAPRNNIQTPIQYLFQHLSNIVDELDSDDESRELSVRSI